MEVLDQNTRKANEGATDAGALTLDPSSPANSGTQSKGSSILDSDFNEVMSQGAADLDPRQPGTDSSRRSTASSDSTETESEGKMGTCNFAGTPLCQCSKSGSKGSEISNISASEDRTHAPGAGDHDHAPDVSGSNITHVEVEKLQGGRALDSTQVSQSSVGKLLSRALSFRGDILDGGAGNDVVIGGRGSDIFFGDKGGINTITTGAGRDSIILGKETTNRIFDFNPSRDKFILADGLTADDITIVQGTNPANGGLRQPLDSTRNALVIDKNSGHILASLTFTKAEDISAQNFGVIRTQDADRLRGDDQRINRFFKVQKGEGQLNATLGRDKLVGGDGDDFLYVGDDGFKFRTARGIDEFPFPTDSPGTTTLTTELQGGVLRMNGSYKDFDGFPLFSQGEREIDPNAKILNGSNPQALIEGFLRVPQDVEGNPISGTHLHFSPAGDSRGNFADATVVRFFENTPTDAKSGTFKGEFELNPEEQAALLAGNLYVNLHTNIDGDGDGRAGFPTGENRININRNVVRFV